jgi:hypothetical protein
MNESGRDHYTCDGETGICPHQSKIKAKLTAKYLKKDLNKQCWGRNFYMGTQNGVKEF